MAQKFDYSKKFDGFKNQKLYQKLSPDQQDFIRSLAFNHRFTFQEFREIAEICLDLSMWKEEPLSNWWQEQSSKTNLTGAALKSHLIKNIRGKINQLKSQAKRYPETGFSKPKPGTKQLIAEINSQKKILGGCPVASEKTVCCNLHTIDAVENCVYGCTYCTIQTFYSNQYVFDKDFASKLNAIELETDRFYHFGTGQSSDSLAWGNRYGVLDALFHFAVKYPNILLEFKTKSKNIQYFLDHKVPPNIVCSWSLNTPVIIENEEHFTANFNQRVQAARKLADRGINVAFHFHPMVYYQSWGKDYLQAAYLLMKNFHPDEVLFISFGTVTLIKPVIQKIRQLGLPTKTLQMEMVPDPHGKLTYPDNTKIEMFKAIYDSFKPWHHKVFMYLCMEKSSIWEKTLGHTYKNNNEFENDFAQKTMYKINA